MKIVFWLSLFIVFYTYLGYGIILYALVKLKRWFSKSAISHKEVFTPTLTLVVAAYNEEDIIEAKIKNTLALQYPSEKLKFIFVTDGSTDNTPEIIARHPQIQLLHTPERSGKIAAVHRAMQRVDTEVVVFTDANTFINKEALLRLASHYADKRVGAVSGEKRVEIETASDATAGEGIYWKYESTLKKWDAELYSIVGAAGELFSIRTLLYEPVEPDTILDDFMISMKIAIKGYKIAYEPSAYAIESSSANMQEEYKRKVRISAGGIQSIIRTRQLFNPFFNPILSFEYVSHRVLRWTITPFFMIFCFLFNLSIVVQGSTTLIYMLSFIAQLCFYGAAMVGWLFERKQMRIKLLFIPYYFCFMNYCVLAGMKRYFFSNQSVLWDKAKRK